MWICRYQIAGRRRDMGLGSVDTLSLSEARERAREQRKQRLDGIDPIDARRALVAPAGHRKHRFNVQWGRP